MIRLAISVEGQTEEEFSKDVLTTHLRSHGVEAQPVLLGRARGHGVGGGNVSVGRLASEMAYLSRSFDAVTSLVDFYGFRDRRLGGRERGGAAEDPDPKQSIALREARIRLFSDAGAFSALIDAPLGAQT